MWELSTPFVYLRWFLHNLGYAKSPLYAANGFAMLISFFLARNVFGNCKSSSLSYNAGIELSHYEI